MFSGRLRFGLGELFPNLDQFRELVLAAFLHCKDAAFDAFDCIVACRVEYRLKFTYNRLDFTIGRITSEIWFHPYVALMICEVEMMRYLFLVADAFAGGY